MPTLYRIFGVTPYLILIIPKHSCTKFFFIQILPFNGVIVGHVQREGFEDEPLEMVPCVILVVADEIDEHVVVAVTVGFDIHFPAPSDAFVAIG